MSHKIYQILVYSCMVEFLAGGFCLVYGNLREHGFGSLSILGICLIISSIVCIVIVQSVYRATRKPLPRGDQRKECPNCHQRNDKDAEYCKHCGQKFRNF